MTIKNPTTLRKWSSALIGLFVFSLGLIIVYTTDSITIESLDELTEIEGTYRNIQTVTASRSNTISYDLYVHEYENVFKIAADYVSIFDYYRLQSDNDGKMKLKILIRKSEIDDLNSKEQIKVFGLKRRGEPYLDKDKVLNKDSGSRNSAPWVIVGFSLLAIGIYVYRRYYHYADW